MLLMFSQTNVALLSARSSSGNVARRLSSRNSHSSRDRPENDPDFISPILLPRKYLQMKRNGFNRPMTLSYIHLPQVLLPGERPFRHLVDVVAAQVPMCVGVAVKKWAIV